MKKKLAVIVAAGVIIAALLSGALAGALSPPPAKVATPTQATVIHLTDDVGQSVDQIAANVRAWGGSR